MSTPKYPPVIVKMPVAERKKTVVRYEPEAGIAALVSNIYVSNFAWPNGMPKGVKITVEALEDE